MIAGRLQIEMAANVARLSSDMAQARGVVTSATRQIESAVASAKTALASLGIGVGFQQLIALTDQYTKFTAQLKLATTSQSDYAKALGDVRSIAQAAQADLGGVGVLYARIANGTRELGVSQKQVSQITETVSLALKASGATAAESASAMLQLSQAFGSGVLRGQEFNAVNEAAPRLMKALADGIGVPVGQLRSMAEAGQLTSKVMAEALPRALSELRKEAATVQTIGGAFTVLKNNIMEFIGTQAQANGATRTVSTAITALADNLHILSAVLTGLTVLKVSQWVAGITTALYAKTAAIGSSIAATQTQRTAVLAATAAEIAQAESTLAFITADRARAVSQLQSTQATIAATAGIGAQSAALAANTAATAANSAAMASLANLGRLQATATAQLATAQAAHSAALAGGGVAATGLSRLLGFLGGPIGAITTALGLGATAWVLWGNRSDESAKKAASALESTTPEILSNLEKQNQKLRERIALANAGQPHIAQGGGEGAERLAGLLKQINDLKAKGASITNVDRIQLIETQGQYNDLAKSLGINKNLLGEIEAIGQRKGAAKWMEDYATKAEKMAAELKKARDELGPAFTPELERRIREKFVDKGDDSARKKAEEVLRLYKEVAEIGRSIDVAVMFPQGGDVEKNKRELEDLKKVLTESRKDWIAHAEAVFASADAENTAAAAGESFTQHAEKLRDKLRDLIDPLQAIKREHQEIDVLVATGWMTEMEGRLAKLPQSVRDLLQPIKNIHNEIQQAWEAGLLTTEQMQAAVLRAQTPLEKTDDIARRLGMTFESTFENLVFGAKEGVKASKLLEAGLMDVLKILFRIQVTEPLAKGISDMGGGGGFFNNLLSTFGLGRSAPLVTEMVPGQFSLVNPAYGHSGGIVDALKPLRTVAASVFDGARRFHSGGMPGLMSNEVPVIAKRDEGIFTPGQMRALAPVNDQPSVSITQNINVDSRSDIASVRAAMAAAKNEAVREVANQVRRGGSFRKAVRG